jgi:hypothetical protein
MLLKLEGNFHYCLLGYKALYDILDLCVVLTNFGQILELASKLMVIRVALNKFSNHTYENVKK